MGEEHGTEAEVLVFTRRRHGACPGGVIHRQRSGTVTLPDDDQRCGTDVVHQLSDVRGDRGGVSVRTGRKSVDGDQQGKLNVELIEEEKPHLPQVGVADELGHALLDHGVCVKRGGPAFVIGGRFHSSTVPPTGGRIGPAVRFVGGAREYRDVQDRMCGRGDENGAMPRTVLVVLNQPSADAPPCLPGAPALRLADPGVAQLNVLDLAVTRGDGVFESVSLIEGQPHALSAHLARLATSARMLDLPAPDEAAWRGAVRLAAGELDPVREGAVKLVLSRGIEGDGRPTGWAYAAPAPDYAAVRSTGVRVILLDRGYRSDVETTSPWLLTAAKSLSYAVNRAALREAARRNADDVVFVSSDGVVLEGPTSSIIVRIGNRFGTPRTGSGILPGTTQGDVFEWGQGRGFQTGFLKLTPNTLRTTDAAWLVSSSRHAVPIRAIDGDAHPVDQALTDEMNAFLASRGIR